MSDLSKARCILIGLTIAAYVVVFSLVPVLDLRVDYGSFAKPVLLLALIGVAASLLTTKTNSLKIRATLENYLCGLLLIIPVVVATYLAARVDMPWADDELRAMDEALGLNWLAVIGFVDSYKYLSWALNAAYVTFQYQMLCLPLILALSGNVLKSYQMMIIQAVICFISCVISIWYPALGTYAVHDIDPGQLKHINGIWGTIFLDELTGVRNDPNFIFSLQKMQGIVTFPSVHAAVAVLCAWAAWEIRWLRYPFLLLNILMAASAGIVANHYFVDLIAGFGIAGFSISAVSFIFRPRRSGVRSADRASPARPEVAVS